ncbi:MAG TPA: DUF1638 domain-containing protein [Bacillota bacterium]|nr:DUF1638 domain-containing protein [Bacillota bacterium]
MKAGRRFKLIACEVLFREFCYAVAHCGNVIDPVFLPKGLHDIGGVKMADLLQEEIEKVDDSKYEAILLGYGLCNLGVQGLHSHLPLAIPRAHDCITLLMGSKEQYAEYFQKNPGTYFKSTGWIERAAGSEENPQSLPYQLGMNQTYQEFLQKYGYENAQYLMEVLGDWRKNYRKLAYIDTGFGDFQSYREDARKEAAEKGWEYEEIRGSVGMLLRFLNGNWDPGDFLVVPAGKTIQPAYTREIVTC